MSNTKFLIGTTVALLLTFSFIFPGFVSAHPSEPGEAPNVWSGKLPGSCTSLYRPVHDAGGNIYSNACVAARDGARVTWDGIHR